MLRSILITLLLTLTGPATADETGNKEIVDGLELEVVRLNHISADEAATVLQPFLTPADTISHKGNSLFIRATPRQMADLKKIITELDRTAPAAPAAPPLQPLLISVWQQLEGEPAPGSNSSVLRTKRRDKTVPIQQVRVLEGQIAEIDVGGSVPFVSEAGKESVKIEQMRISSGFSAIAEIEGDQVTLIIAPYSASAASGGAVDQQQARTTLRGQVGEWLLVAGSRTRMENNNQNKYRTGSRSQQARQVWVKVEALD